MKEVNPIKNSYRIALDGGHSANETLTLAHHLSRFFNLCSTLLSMEAWQWVCSWKFCNSRIYASFHNMVSVYRHVSVRRSAVPLCSWILWHDVCLSC